MKHKPAFLGKAGQLVQQFGEAVLHSAEVSVDVLCAVCSPDESLVVCEGQLSGLLQDLRALLGQALGLARQLIHAARAQLRQIRREIRIFPPILGKTIFKYRNQDTLIFHVYGSHD